MPFNHEDLDDAGVGDPFDELVRGTQRALGGKTAKKWPQQPDHYADVGAIRDYLTVAAGLPEHWHVQDACRLGQWGSDAMTLTIRTPGKEPDVTVRFDAQREAAKPATLHQAISAATRGRSRMKYPTPGQACDFFGMCCALAEVMENSTVADETQDWLDEFVTHTWEITGHSLIDTAKRYDGLGELCQVAFERLEAQRYLRGDLDDKDLPRLLIDTRTKVRWIRVGDLATYIRHVIGIKGGVSQTTLDARLREIGVQRAYIASKTATGYRKARVYCLPPAPKVES